MESFQIGISLFSLIRIDRSGSFKEPMPSLPMVEEANQKNLGFPQTTEYKLLIGGLGKCYD
jgi:hypothetical protein